MKVVLYVYSKNNKQIIFEFLSVKLMFTFNY